ncbi:MarR family winged helix-turn-helix transcriptional regulator [Inmirania thermothiophila]|nr:MarR family transcriptional regulator [Inmirania thermothiophila]
MDFDLLPELLGYHLRRAQVAVFNDFMRSMAEFQITPGQFGILVLIGANEGLSQSALARAVGVERSTMVSVMDNLERRGLVARRPSPADRRSYALELTARGRALLAELKPRVREHEARIARRLGGRDPAELIELLRRIAG